MENNLQINPEALKSAKDLKCSVCEGIHFDQVFIIKHISKLLALTQKDVIIPIPVFICHNCGVQLESEK